MKKEKFTSTGELIILDKFYTPVDLAKRLIEKTYEIIGKENITEIIEPSAGNGAFSNQIENCIAYDLLPEGEGIIKQDFLTLELEYKPGRLFIGNPPFGTPGTKGLTNLDLRFINKSLSLGEYVAFILPIGKKSRTMKLKYNVLYEEDLGETSYSGNLVRCCFLILKKYKNKKKVISSYDIFLIDTKKTTLDSSNYYFLSSWGGQLGLQDFQKQAYQISINKKHSELEEFLKTFKILNFKKDGGTAYLSCSEFLLILKEEGFPGIEIVDIDNKEPKPLINAYNYFMKPDKEHLNVSLYDSDEK